MDAGGVRWGGSWHEEEERALVGRGLAGEGGWLGGNKSKKEEGGGGGERKSGRRRGGGGSWMGKTTNLPTK